MASEVAGYADLTTYLLLNAVGESLAHHLDILLRQEYQNQEARDFQFYNSVWAVSLTIRDLKQNADSKKRDIEDFRQKFYMVS